MRFAIMIEAQMGLSYEEQLAIARRAEAAGFEAFFRSDHYQSFPGPEGRTTTDAWAVLAGLARDTSTIGLGVLVSPVMYRTAGNLVKTVTTVDHMSGGRVELGVGAGWNDGEHRQHGFAFPPIAERADRLEETLEVIHGLWEEPDGWSFQGSSVSVEDARFYPKPVRRPGRDRPNLIVGGSGTPRSYRIAARWADEFNVTSASPEAVARVYAALDDACVAAGRSPRTLVHSAMIGVLVGADEAELGRRGDALMAELSSEEAFDPWWAERRQRWITGTPEAARAAVERFAAVGVERIMLQDFIPRDLDHIDLMGEVLIGR